MFSGVRGFIRAVAVVSFFGAVATMPAYAAEDLETSNTRITDAAKSEFVTAAPSPAEPVELTLKTAQSVSVDATEVPKSEAEQSSILPVPLPPALLCLLTAFGGLMLLGRRRNDTV